MNSFSDEARDFRGSAESSGQHWSEARVQSVESIRSSTVA